MPENHPDPLQQMLARLRRDQHTRVGRIMRGADAEETLGSVTLVSPGPDRPGVVANSSDMGPRGRAEVPPKPGDSGAWLRALYYETRAQSPLGVR